jgi:hypothetical protein
MFQLKRHNIKGWHTLWPLVMVQTVWPVSVGIFEKIV